MNEITTLSKLLAVDNLNNAASQFISEGLVDIMGTPTVSIALVEGHVAKTAMYNFQKIVAYGKVTSPSKKKLNAASDDDVEAYRNYVSYIAKLPTRGIKKAGPAFIGTNLTKVAMEAINLEAGFSPQPEALFDPDKADPVQRAWWIAVRNRQQMIQRMGAIYFLRSQAWPHLYGLEKETLEQAVSIAVSHLNHQIISFQDNEMKFAILLGGEALEATKKRITEDSFGPNMSIIQYTTDRGIIPGSYSSSVDEGLRESISKYSADNRTIV